MRVGLSLPRQPRKKRLQSPWAVAHNCSKKNWITKCCLGWPSSTNFTCLRRQILYRRDEKCACCWSQAIFQRLSKRHSGTMTSMSPFKVVLPSMMDLVIKQLWTILITHLGTAARQDGCLPSTSTFKSPWLEMIIHYSSLRYGEGYCPIGVPAQNKSPIFFLYSIHLWVCRKKVLNIPEN